MMPGSNEPVVFLNGTLPQRDTKLPNAKALIKGLALKKAFGNRYRMTHLRERVLREQLFEVQGSRVLEQDVVVLRDGHVVEECERRSLHGPVMSTWSVQVHGRKTRCQVRQTVRMAASTAPSSVVLPSDDAGRSVVLASQQTPACDASKYLLLEECQNGDTLLLLQYTKRRRHLEIHFRPVQSRAVLAKLVERDLRRGARHS